MANNGRDDNGSQFFFTLGECKELQGRHTLFGRVEGESVFNLVGIGEGELCEGEGSERPLYPVMITGGEVLVNPFEGMVAGVKEVSREGKGEEGKEGRKKRPKRKAAKGLLSFGGEEGEGDHDVAPVVKAKFNSKLVEGDEATSFSVAKAPKRVAPDANQSRSRKRRATLSPSPLPVQQAEQPAKKQKQDSRPPSPETSPEPETAPQKGLSALERTNAQIAELKKSLQRNVTTAPAETHRKVSALEAMIPSTATKGRRRKPAGAGSAVSREEQRALDSFNAFRRRLDATPAAVPASEGEVAEEEAATNGDHAEANGDQDVEVTKADADGAEDDDANLCDLHFIPNCQSCKKWDDEDAGEKSDEEGDTGWMSHRLTFEKDRLGKSLEWKRQNEKELVVIDPREKEKDMAAERARAKKERAK